MNAQRLKKRVEYVFRSRQGRAGAPLLDKEGLGEVQDGRSTPLYLPLVRGNARDVRATARRHVVVAILAGQGGAQNGAVR